MTVNFREQLQSEAAQIISEAAARRDNFADVRPRWPSSDLPITDQARAWRELIEQDLWAVGHHAQMSEGGAGETRFRQQFALNVSGAIGFVDRALADLQTDAKRNGGADTAAFDAVSRLAIFLDEQSRAEDPFAEFAERGPSALTLGHRPLTADGVLDKIKAGASTPQPGQRKFVPGEAAATSPTATQAQAWIDKLDNHIRNAQAGVVGVSKGKIPADAATAQNFIDEALPRLESEAQAGGAVDGNAFKLIGQLANRIERVRGLSR